MSDEERQEILIKLGQVDGKQDLILEQLEKLNGKVARHEMILNCGVGVVLASPFFWWAFNNLAFNGR